VHDANEASHERHGFGAAARAGTRRGAAKRCQSALAAARTFGGCGRRGAHDRGSRRCHQVGELALEPLDRGRRGTRLARHRAGAVVDARNVASSPSGKDAERGIGAAVCPSLAPTTTPATAPSVPEQPRVAPTPSHPLMPSIERETALLREAQRALGSGNARAALSWLDRYDREIGHGSLAEEAAAARAVATCTLSKARAVATLAAFRTLYPASPLLPRVQATCTSGTSHDDFELDSRNPATKIQER